jgi:hypothetical protein
LLNELETRQRSETSLQYGLASAISDTNEATSPKQQHDAEAGVQVGTAPSSVGSAAGVEQCTLFWVPGLCGKNKQVVKYFA